MSVAQEILKLNARVQKIIPEKQLINEEATAELNEYGVLELYSQDGAVRLSIDGVRQLNKLLTEWYGELLYNKEKL